MGRVLDSGARILGAHVNVSTWLATFGGDPALLWVGNLDANKDPLTVLRGVSMAARELPAELDADTMLRVRRLHVVSHSP